MITLTKTALGMFRDCRRKYRLRYLENIVPLTYDESLTFGQLIHEMLAACERDGGDFWPIVEALLAKVEEPHASKACALFEAYLEWDSNCRDWDIHGGDAGIEQTFTVPIINPETGASSKTYEFRGKIDALIRRDQGGGLWVKEYKTTAQIDEDTISRLWCGWESRLLVSALRRQGLTIEGICYTLMEKCSLKKKEEESESDFTTRRDALAAKNKSGKSSAERQLGETWGTYRDRCREWYREHAGDRILFHREWMVVTEEETREIQQELWDLTQSALEARRKDLYYRNTSHCHLFRECEYWKACRTNMSPVVMESFYRKEEPHQELATEGPPVAVTATEQPKGW